MNKEIEIEISPRQIASAITNLLNEKEKLQQENEELKELYETQTNFNKKLLNKFAKKDRVLKELRSWLEAMVRIYENEYKDVNAAEHYNSVLSKLNELESNKDEKV